MLTLLMKFMLDKEAFNKAIPIDAVIAQAIEVEVKDLCNNAAPTDNTPVPSLGPPVENWN